MQERHAKQQRQERYVDPLPIGAHDVLDFWLGDALTLGWPSQNRSAFWFHGDKALDADITRRFGALVEQALEGGLGEWESKPLSRLALVLLLDQFTRNVYRGRAQAFAGDGRAQQLVREALALGWDVQLPLAARVFLYMPLMHAEDPSLQELCVRCFETLLAQAPRERRDDLQGNLDFARQHRDIIARYGRFPYRNQALGRTDTEQEQVFLRDGPRFGQ